MSEGEALKRQDLAVTQHFTEPPPRFSEASLVQSLESYGIGRPSTYAPILSTIQERGYVVRVDKRLEPTGTGVLVNEMMVQYFPEIVDMNFTASMEDDLDKIADGETDWVQVMDRFYHPFIEKVQIAQAEMPVAKSGPEPIGRACPECGKDLVIRFGRYGKFISCAGFPDCRHTEPWLDKIGVICPRDHGDLVERKTRKGRVFYGCANYPSCEFTSWKRPLAQPCPKCGGMLLLSNKREAACMNCNESFVLENILPEAAE
jgi:DNA topoisomerase-1